MRQISTVLLFFFLSISVSLSAQQLEDHAERSEQFLWLRYNLEVPLNERWQLEQEIENRAFIMPWRQGEFRLRSHLIRKLGKGWQVDLGGMLVWETEPIEPRRLDKTLRLEIRPHQAISYEQSLGKSFSIQHSYKIEERFFRNQNEEGYYRDAGISLGQVRFKYELELGYQLNEWFGLIAFNEVVLYTGPNIGPNPFDRNESGGGFSFKLSDSFSLEAIYNYRYNPDGIGKVVVNQHVGRFTLSHTIQRE